MTTITPVLLAGGIGTRLWPLSRKSFPKQFSKLLGEKSLFQESALRLTSKNNLKFGPHLTLTNSDFRFIVSDQLRDVGVKPGPILIEPEARNTAPAILAASIFAYKQDKDAILLIAPTDHIIQDLKAFHESIKIGLNAISHNKIVTFGITPEHPETGYGYLELDSFSSENFSDVLNFIEKPEKSLAQKMLEAGNFLWNAGIFMFSAKSMISAFEKHASDYIDFVSASLEKSTPDLDFLRLEPKAWGKCLADSIDYVIMEKVDNLAAVPLAVGWSDLGGWDSVWKRMEPDQNGVSLSENAYSIECSNTLLRAEEKTQAIVGLGLDNIVAVAMTDAVLIASKDKAQNVKEVVASLKSKEAPQAELFPKDYRPWGWFESLTIAKGFQVKRIFVNPGAALSLQSHKFRSEHWVVVEGTAKVTVGEIVKLLTEGQSVYIPLGEVHRLENPSHNPMILIEVQTGSYLGEDDITRYEDRYARK